MSGCKHGPSQRVASSGDANASAILQRVSLDRVIATDELQIRHRLCEATVDRYRKAMDAGNTFPPLKVAAIGDSEALLLIDGFHRLHAMRDASATLRG